MQETRVECRGTDESLLEHYRELALLKKSNPNLKILIRLGGKSSQYTRYMKHSNMAAQLVRSLIWYVIVSSSMSD